MIERLEKSRAQAMTEYAIVTAALLGSMMVLGKYLVPDFIDAYQFYFDQLYFMLNLPIP
jgi:hypothetical protein